MTDLAYVFVTIGIALLYLQLHRVSHDASHLQRALDYVKRSMRILNGRKVTFLCGDAGPLAVGAVVHHKLNNTADSKDCLSRWVCVMRHGRVWILFCCRIVKCLYSSYRLPSSLASTSFCFGPQSLIQYIHINVFKLGHSWYTLRTVWTHSWHSHTCQFIVCALRGLFDVFHLFCID